MIVDTSALIAIISGETAWERLREAINSSAAIVPAPVLTEFNLVVAGRGDTYLGQAQAMVSSMLADGVKVAAFGQRHAEIATIGREKYGRGNGRGGKLNFGDLMVYAIAKDLGQPLLCTGKDFTITDLMIHPASRLDA